MHTLVPIIAIPTDNQQSFDRLNQWSSGLDTALKDALKWWYTHLRFQPFALCPVSVRPLNREVAGYLPDTQEAIRAELAQSYSELNAIPPFTTLYVVYAALGRAPYYCPGDRIGTSGVNNSPPVLIVQSSGSLDAFADGDDPHDMHTGTRDEQTGALAHELGHALNLLHPTDPYTQRISVMWSWWAYPMCTISRDEWNAAEAFTRGW